MDKTNVLRLLAIILILSIGVIVGVSYLVQPNLYYISNEETSIEDTTDSNDLVDIVFTEEDLSNYQEITRYLISPSYGGKVNSVEKCVYNQNTGEVYLLTNCTGKTGGQYYYQINGVIEPELTDLTPIILIEKMRSVEITTEVILIN